MLHATSNVNSDWDQSAASILPTMLTPQGASTAETEIEHNEVLETTTSHPETEIGPSNGSSSSTPDDIQSHFSFDEGMTEQSLQSPEDEPVIQPIIENGVENYYCHLCSFCGPTKEHLLAHAVGHHEHRCDQCNYTSRTEGRLKQHIQRFHVEAGGGSLDEINHTTTSISGQANEEPTCSFGITDSNSRIDRTPGHPTATTPSTSTPSGKNAGSQRRKVHRCKQCDFTCTTKKDFWIHARIHIKPEKRLDCPQCDFVTEYKHHLEYHLRNHFGSKPFKCIKCEYACVNKSMLNSHMKSHTNIYQFRCADCEYATKYCHSLKLHLRKRDHKPASILRLDGTVDHDTSALLVIKKSGPKGSKPKPDTSSTNDMPRKAPPPQPAPAQPSSRDSSSLAYPMTRPTGIMPFWQARAQPPPPMMPMNLLRGVFQPWLHQQMFRMQYPDATPYGDYNTLNATNTAAMGSNALGHTNRINEFDFKMAAVLRPNMIGAHYMGAQTSTALPLRIPESNSFTSLARADEPAYPDRISIKPTTSTNASNDTESPLDLTVTLTARRRARKRKAHKLDALCLKLQKKADDEVNRLPCPREESHPDMSDGGNAEPERAAQMEEQEPTYQPPVLTEQLPEAEQNNNTLISSSPRYSPIANKPSEEPSSGSTKPSPISDSQGRFSCPYCDITFENCIMYSVHMGYHGFSNPFKCNICGEETEDKVSFFLHIARVPHN